MLKRNIVANFGGSVWIGLMSLVFVPLYIHFMGIEAYGLIGVFSTLLTIFALLDMGLSASLAREMARLAVQEDKAQEMRDLVRTLEIPYWVVGLFIAGCVVSASRFIAYRWVQAGTLSPQSVQTAIVIMGLTVAFQWPISFYSGGLMGLQRQVLLNVINTVMATFRGLGALVVLWGISPTVEAFFTWQFIVSAANIGIIVYFLWRSLPNTHVAPCFRKELLLNIWRFAGGVAGIAALATILTNVDKIILSRMLPLDAFGYYSLASVASMSLFRLISPVFQATCPRLTNLMALGDTEELARLYHKSAQLVSVLVLPAAFVLALFSKEVLLLWTQNPVTADRTHLLLSLLVIGTACNGLMNIPYALQLAAGWTRLTFFVDLGAVLLLVPLMIAFTMQYGAVGATSLWVAVNAGCVIVMIPLMHRRLLRNEKWRWYLQDVGRPLLAAAAVGVAGRFLISSSWPTMMFVLGLAVVSGGSLVAAACSANRLDFVSRSKTAFNACRTRVFRIGECGACEHD